MKLHQAIAIAKESTQWYRPVAWNGSGYALEIKNDRVSLVPRGSDVCSETAPNMTEEERQEDEWEVVSEDTVITERGVWK
jgi:hypothetical protein